ncbi:DUF6036 family nucleotidyltransferase [Duganella qianjiadongensis]|uniref:Uncharacterized protein n=1 Tax=Duganella qianjiadongensis TaxID=2692176 RepID=A0ABW9VM28_9BURK|nr:DUF6036 family nucleotidyltransferase [Duganella qianjiadongensis]MYM40550.1 hypothetical protein [Duganella qianjiadongensis]
MRREQVLLALKEAAKCGRHTEFVIAGSLSVLGLKEVPPELMSISIDIDFFPLRDPTQVQDIVAELGEDSAFHEQHGYYLDPISSSILVLPPGWMGRLVMLEFGGIHAYFLDVNDTAISKYVRSAENDFRWIDAGLEAGLLDLDIIEGRAQFGLDYPGEDDKRRVLNGIRSHRAARNEDGTLRHELLATLRSYTQARIANLSDDDHQYTGDILYAAVNRVVQEVEPDVFVIHDSSCWDYTPLVGQKVSVIYAGGVATVKGMARPSPGMR